MVLYLCIEIIAAVSDRSVLHNCAQRSDSKLIIRSHGFSQTRTRIWVMNSVEIRQLSLRCPLTLVS